MPRVIMRAIAPKTAFSTKNIRDEIKSMLRNEVGPDLRKELGNVVSSFDTPIKFTQKGFERTDAIGIDVYATGKGADLFNLLDVGARRHPITARRGGVLSFRDGRGYRAATTPRSLKTRRKSSRGRIIRKRSVDHPGFKAREFYLTLAEQYDPTFQKKVSNALGRGAART